MYLIVAGGGKVGYYLTKALRAGGQEVTLIERTRSRFELLQEEFGDVALLGDACEIATLEQAGAARADLVAAVTGDDEDNLVICQMAKRKFKVKRVIARINNPKNEVTFQLLGIDETVSSTKLIYSLIQQEVEVADVIPLTALRRGHWSSWRSPSRRMRRASTIGSAISCCRRAARWRSWSAGRRRK